MKEYTARVSDKQGRKLYESKPYETREAAIADAFEARATAKECSSCYGIGFDLRWHKREDHIS